MSVIYVDPRIGNKGGRETDYHDIKDALIARRLVVAEKMLAAGDVHWYGEGPEEEGRRPVSVGAEIKSVSDLISCMKGGRFAGAQLPGLKACYEVSYLIVVGSYRPGSNGELLVPGPGGWREAKAGPHTFDYSTLQQWLTTMEERAGLRIRRVYDKRELVAEVHSLWSWWRLGIEHHKSHRAYYEGDGDRNRQFTDYASLVPPTTFYRFMKSMKVRLGAKEIKAAEKKFGGSILKAAAATEKDWLEVEGIGSTTAKKLFAVMK
jgi:hypothetical protein